MTGSVLVLGANGRFGRHAAEAFWNAGWRVRLFDRATDDLTTAARGVDVIVNGWNPPYPRWAAELPGLTRQVIDAARTHGATILQPANVYVYGAEAPARFAPDTPHRATNPLGRLRIEMEQTLRASGVPTILLRAGDFIDTERSGNWFDAVLTRRLPGGPLVYPGPLDRDHAWAYLPDVAQAAVALCDRRADLPRFADIGFPGHTLTGAALARALGDALGHDVRVKRMSWWPLRVAAPFWPLGRGLVEMRYLWDKPHHIDGTDFRAILPDFRETPVDEALRRALAHPKPGRQTAAAVTARA